MRFISFGSGSCGNCYCLFTASEGLVIDAGIGGRILKKYFREYGVSLSCVKGVLITHDHADHVKAVGVIGSVLGVPVYATPKVHEGINRNYCVKKKIDKSLVRFLEKGEEMRLGGFSVTPFGVPHDSCDNVGYCIRFGGVTFCIMTDIGTVTDEMKGYIKEADCLVIEANYDEEMLETGKYPAYLKQRIASGSGHLSNKDCAKALEEAASERLRKVWLCHLSEENNHPELARKTVDMTLRGMGRMPGRDIELVVLTRKTPSGVYDLDADVTE